MNLFIGYMVLVQKMFNYLREHLISKTCVLKSSSAVKGHASQAYRNMEMTWERIRFSFDPRDVLLFQQMASAL